MSLIAFKVLNTRELSYQPTLFLLLIISVFSTSASELPERVIWATESWENFSQKNGKGLYHELIDSVFAIKGIKVEKHYVPFKRALMLVEHQKADITGGINNNDTLILSDTAILVTGLSILHKKNNPKINSFSDLPNFIGTWPQTYEREFLTREERKLLSGFPSTDRAASLQRILDGKADYYLDARGILTDRLASIEPETSETLMITHLRPRFLKMAFSNTNRGRQIKSIFENGILQLHTSGRLQKIYEKYNRTYLLNHSD